MKLRLSEAIEALRASGIDSPEHDARELFIAYGGFSRTLPPRLNDEAQSDALCEAIRRRAAREPLQYILGEVAFYREVYRVTPEVLIPRSDTEILVEAALARLRDGAKFLDLCAGSGCVGISTLCNSSGTECIAVDISEGAVKIARENAELNRVGERYTAIRQDLTETVPSEILARAPFDAILSNPPYVASAAYERLEAEIYSEPKIAFVGGEDGGDFYRRLTPLYRPFLSEGGFIAYEIGFDQARLLRNIAEENRMNIEIIPDLSGNPRVAILTDKRP
jgi:release factor glutamine methyltransferase